MSAALVAGLLAGYGIAVPVGAVAAYLVALTARTSLRVGAGAALGVATADGLYALVAVAGGSALAPLVEPVALPLRWASAVVLVAMAGRGAVTALRHHRAGRAPGGRADRGPAGPLRAYLALLSLTLMNPVTVLYFTALVLAGQGDAAPGHAERALFVLAAFVASASWQLLLVGGGALLGRGPTGPRGRLATALLSSAVITALAVRLALAPS
ncbi:LysE/ArgO family amino acid transporter [Streptomyces sp. NPDC060184]|uniref:LysE/ArgO family amino acid transporter n=1 Tax=Streptomyces sp. NPDC060184 TaxID=3347064 RepID=UPI0036657311